MDQKLEPVKECNVCGAIDFIDELIAGAWTLKRCIAYQYVFTSPRYREEELSRIYRESYYENSEQYFQTQVQPTSMDDVALGKSIRKLCIGDHPRSLDVGTGVGKMVAAFSKAGFQAQGTELSDLACKVAQTHGRDVINARLETFQAGSYQCVSAFHVLEHFPSRTQFLKEITRITSPGGIVIVEVPNFGCKASRKLRENCLPSSPTPTFLTLLPKRFRIYAGVAPWRLSEPRGWGEREYLPMHPADAVRLKNQPPMSRMTGQRKTANDRFDPLFGDFVNRF